MKEIAVNSEWVFEAPDVRDNFVTVLPKTGVGDPNGTVQGAFLGQLYVSTTGVPYICTALQDGETDSAWGELTLVGA